MNSQIATPPNPRTSLAPTVFSILDSKIQFLEYQIHTQFDPNMQTNSNYLIAYEKLMDFYGEKCAALKLLQILKEWVKEDNASLIFNLLQNDEYLKYSESRLEEMVRINDFAFA